MRNQLLAMIVLVLAVPMTGTAQQAAPATSEPVPAPTPAPTTAPAPPQTPPSEPEYSSYFVVKGGYFGSRGDFEGNSFSGNGAFEAAIGWGRTFGLELGSGYMETDAAGVKVKTVPVLLSLRLALPIGILAPFGEVGGGAYWNEATAGGTSSSGWSAGWHAGLGVDLLLGRLLLGAQARYMSFSKDFSSIGNLDLDRYQVLARAGLRF